MRGPSSRLSRGQSHLVDVLVLLTWTFIVVPCAMLLLLPWRQLLPVERLLLLLGVGLVMAVLAVTAELWRRRSDRARRYADELHLHASNIPDELSGCVPMSAAQWAELKRICS